MKAQRTKETSAVTQDLQQVAGKMLIMRVHDKYQVLKVKYDS